MTTKKIIVKEKCFYINTNQIIEIAVIPGSNRKNKEFYSCYIQSANYIRHFDFYYEHNAYIFADFLTYEKTQDLAHEGMQAIDISCDVILWIKLN